MAKQAEKIKKPPKRVPSLRVRKAVANYVENGGNTTKALLDAGYLPATVNSPKSVTETKAWKQVIAEALPDPLLAAHHKALLTSSRIDHMVFPLGPEGEDDINLSGGVNKKATVDEDEELGGDALDEGPERTTLTDQEIIDMLAEVNCTVRRIVHGETARHVYFWAADNRSRKDALDMAYKLKGGYTDPGAPPPGGKVVNNFFYQPNIQASIKNFEDEVKRSLAHESAPPDEKPLE